MGCGASTPAADNDAPAAAGGPRVYPERDEGKRSPPLETENEPSKSTSESKESQGRTPAETKHFLRDQAESLEHDSSAGLGSASPSIDRDIAIAAEEQKRDREHAKANVDASVSPVALFRAAKKGDAAAIMAALDAGVDVNARGMWQNTALICACQYSAPEAAILLIKAPGCDVTATNEKGCSAIHHAAMEGQADVVRCLLSAGAKPLVQAAKLFNENADMNEILDPLQAAFASCDGDTASAMVDAVLRDATAKEYSGVERCLNIVLQRNLTSVVGPAIRLGFGLGFEDTLSIVSAGCNSEITALAILESLSETDLDHSRSMIRALMTVAATKGWHNALAEAKYPELPSGGSIASDSESLLLLAVKSGSVESVHALVAQGYIFGLDQAKAEAKQNENHAMIEVLEKETSLVTSAADPTNRQGEDEVVSNLDNP